MKKKKKKRGHISRRRVDFYPQIVIMSGSPGQLSEELVTWEKRKKGWGMSCDVGKATEGLENEL